MGVLFGAIGPIAALLAQGLLYVYQAASTTPSPERVPWFDVASSLLLAASVFLAPLPTYLPVYARLHGLARRGRPQWALRAHYAVVGFLASFLGAQLYSFFGWLFDATASLGREMQAAAFPPQPSAILIRNVFSSVFPSEQIPFLTRTIIVAVLLSAVQGCSRSFGARASLYRKYNRHPIKFELRKEETRFEFIALGLGLTLTYYLTLSFLAFGALRALSDVNLDQWVRGQAAARATNRSRFDSLTYSIYANVLMGSVTWAPFLERTLPGQTDFAVLMCAPLTSVFFIALAFRASASRLTVFRTAAQTAYAVPVAAAGLVQFVNPQASPLTHHLAMLTAPLFDEALKQPFIFMVSLVTLTALLSSAAEVWIDTSDVFEGAGDPIAAFLNRKRVHFVRSLVLRTVCLIPYLAFGTKAGASQAYSAGYALAFGCTLMIDDDIDEYAKRLRESFGEASLAASTARWRQRVSVFLNLRNLVNVGFVAGLVAYLLAFGDLVARIAAGPAALLLALFYYVLASIEVESARRFLGLELRMCGVPARTARRVTLGLYRIGLSKRDRLDGDQAVVGGPLDEASLSRPPKPITLKTAATQGVVVVALLVLSMGLLLLLLKQMATEYDQNTAEIREHFTAQAVESIPKLKSVVNDYAFVIGRPGSEEIERAAKALSFESRVIVLVATVKRIAPFTDVRVYAARMLQKSSHAFGRSGSGRGILILYAVDDRLAQIALGADLADIEGQELAQIQRRMNPLFTGGRYDVGFLAGVNGLGEVLRARALR